MTGLRGVRQRLKDMREELDADRNRPRLVTMEAGAEIDEATVDALLDRELGMEREHCLVVGAFLRGRPTPHRRGPTDRGCLVTSLRGVREQVREMRAGLASGRPQRLIAVSTAAEADEVQSRLAPGDDALIVVTGVPRVNGAASDLVTLGIGVRRGS